MSTPPNFMWEKGVMRKPLLSFDEGQKVLIAPNPFRHSKRVGKTWFVFNGRNCLQVSEELAGRGLSQLVKTLGQYGDQDAANHKFAPHFTQWQKALK